MEFTPSQIEALLKLGALAVILIGGGAMWAWRNVNGQR